MRRLLNITLIALVIASGLVFGQGGSNYSIMGFGRLTANTSAAYEGLGGTSIAMPLKRAISPINPALWSKATMTRLVAGYTFNQHLLQDAEDNLLFQNNGQISGIKMLFVVDTALGITASFGINPYTDVKYLISTPIEVNYEGSSVTGQSEFQGKGGLSIGYIGGSTNILDNLSIGAKAFSTFGIINYLTTTSFNDANYFRSQISKEEKFNGYGFKVGVLYSPFHNFNFGAFVERHNKLESEEKLTYISELQPDTSFSEDIPIQPPNSFGVGVSYLSGKFLLGADYKMFQLKDLEFNKGPTTEYQDYHHFSLGVSRLGSGKIGAEYLDKISYNFGLGYKNLYYKINGEDINEYYVSFGANAPIKGSAVLDFAITFGKRGKNVNNLLSEYYGRLNVEISIGETWFEPIKREY